MGKAQLDMFAAPEPDLFTPEAAIAYPDEGRVRGKLQRMLSDLEAAVALEPHRRMFYEQVVPQMSLALPADERAEVQRAFARELARLG